MSYTMIDLFAGIGGFSLGFEAAGAECIGHCEIDKHAQKSYAAIHGGNEGRWFTDDIRMVRPEDVPKCDIITAGFPCQDISCAGKGAGLSGERSSLFFEIIRLVEGKTPEDRPRWLVLENVKNLLYIAGGRDFTTILHSLAELGYDIEFQLLNSKNYGVPQSRNRVYIIGHLRGKSGGKVFPLAGADGKALIQVIAGRQGERVYDPEGVATTQCAVGGGAGSKTGLYAVPANRAFIDMCSTKTQITDHARCITAKYDSGFSMERSGVLNLPCPVISPERENTRQNGRRVRDANEPMYTLTASDRHGILARDIESQRIRIRVLTPRECWRLQGVPDDLFDKASAITSDTQLYRQAGNGVTVNVVYTIANKLLNMGEGGAET